MEGVRASSIESAREETLSTWAIHHHTVRTRSVYFDEWKVRLRSDRSLVTSDCMQAICTIPEGVRALHSIHCFALRSTIKESACCPVVRLSTFL